MISPAYAELRKWLEEAGFHNVAFWKFQGRRRLSWRKTIQHPVTPHSWLNI